MNFTIANATRNTLSKKAKDNKYAVDNYEINLEDQNDSHAILANCAIGSKQILDVGCGVGYIGRAVKKQQTCTIEGIDVDKTALKIASKYYDKTFLMRIGDKTDKAFLSFIKSKKSYDCIICGDLIEHLTDPGYFISILSKKLTKDGKILVSIPNIAHIDVVANLVDGRFNYGETGILDNTHLRFWTESSFYEFIGNVNETYQTTLSPKLITKTTAEQSYFNIQNLRKICGDEIFTFQIVFELKNQKSPTIPYSPKKNNFHKILIAIDSQNEVGRLKAELAKKDKIIHELETSLSWKITKPLREINAIIHKH